MADLPDIVPLLLEVFMWVGFGVGGLLFFIGLIPLALSGRWVKTEGVVVSGSPSGETYRWIDRDGEVQEATGEATLVREPGDEVTVWFDSWRPSKGRTEMPENGKALRVSGLVLLGVGVLSAVVSIVLMFVLPS